MLKLSQKKIDLVIEFGQFWALVVCVWHWLKKSIFFLLFSLFFYYSKVSLHFLVLFIGLTVLF